MIQKEPMKYVKSMVGAQMK